MDPQGPWNTPGMPGAPGGPMFVHPDAWHDAWWAGPVHLLPLLLLAILIGVLVWGVLRLTAERTPMLAGVGAPERPQAAPPPRDQALEELRVRYARGEVDRTDYLARSADLGGPVPDMPTDPPLEDRPADQE